MPFKDRRQYRFRGDDREHRKIAEAALGKPLPAGAQVHHVDGDHLNNRNSNLVICQDVAYHFLLHRRTRVLKAGGNPNTDAMCGTCGVPRPISDFYVRGEGRLVSDCKPCTKVKTALRIRVRAA